MTYRRVSMFTLSKIYNHVEQLKMNVNVQIAEVISINIYRYGYCTFRIFSSFRFLVNFFFLKADIAILWNWFGYFRAFQRN